MEKFDTTVDTTVEGWRQDPQVVDLRILLIDESCYWTLTDDQKSKVERIVSYYLFDDSLDTFICSMTPSIGMCHITTEIWFKDGVTDEERDDIENDLDWRQYQDTFVYMTRHDVESYPEDHFEKLGPERIDPEDYDLSDSSVKGSYMDELAAELGCNGLNITPKFEAPAVWHIQPDEERKIEHYGNID